MIDFNTLLSPLSKRRKQEDIDDHNDHSVLNGHFFLQILRRAGKIYDQYPHQNGGETDQHQLVRACPSPKIVYSKHKYWKYVIHHAGLRGPDRIDACIPQIKCNQRREHPQIQNISYHMHIKSGYPYRKSVRYVEWEKKQIAKEDVEEKIFPMRHPVREFLDDRIDSKRNSRQ